MEKLLNPYDKEYMRMAMLKHEETFKEQVYELHRLYRIQKILMKNVASNNHNGHEQAGWNFKNSTATRTNQITDHLNISKRNHQCLDLERPAEEYNAETTGEGMMEIVDESELELTLGPSSFHRRTMRSTGAAIEAPVPLSDSGPSFSSSSTGSNHIRRTTTNSREENHQQWRFDKPMSSNSSSRVEKHLRQDRVNSNNPPWLFQVLHLNMT